MMTAIEDARADSYNKQENPMTEFEKGVRAGIDALIPYFQDENENPLHAELPNRILEMHAEGALHQALADHRMDERLTTPPTDNEHDPRCAKRRHFLGGTACDCKTPTDDDREAADYISNVDGVVTHFHRDSRGRIDIRDEDGYGRGPLNEWQSEGLRQWLRRQGPSIDEWEYGVRYFGDAGDMAAFSSQAVAVSHLNHRLGDALIRRRKAGPWEPVEAARDS